MTRPVSTPSALAAVRAASMRGPPRSAAGQVSGLVWQNVGTVQPTGHELRHPKLAAALQGSTGSVIEIDRMAWYDFGVARLRADHFVESGGCFFQPVAARATPREAQRAMPRGSLGQPTPPAPPQTPRPTPPPTPRTSATQAPAAASRPKRNLLGQEVTDLPAEFRVPHGEFGTCLGSGDLGNYRAMARRMNDGIYVKKLRPGSAAGPLKNDYDYTHRIPQRYTTQEGVIVHGSRPLGAQDPKSYREMSNRMHDGLYTKILTGTNEQIANEKGDSQGQVQVAGSMLMLGSACTGDYQEMSKRVRNGIYTKKFEHSSDARIFPRHHRLPYRAHLLPDEYGDRESDAFLQNSSESPQRSSDINRVPASSPMLSPRAAAPGTLRCSPVTNASPRVSGQEWRKILDSRRASGSVPGPEDAERICKAEASRSPVSQSNTARVLVDGVWRHRSLLTDKRSQVSRPRTASAARGKSSLQGNRPRSGQAGRVSKLANAHFTGGMGMLQDLSDYAALSRRRPELGLLGKPTTFLDLGLLSTLPHNQRVELLSPTKRNERGHGKSLYTEGRASKEEARPRWNLFSASDHEPLKESTNRQMPKRSEVVHGGTKNLSPEHPEMYERAGFVIRRNGGGDLTVRPWTAGGIRPLESLGVPAAVRQNVLGVGCAVTGMRRERHSFLCSENDCYRSEVHSEGGGNVLEDMEASRADTGIRNDTLSRSIEILDRYLMQNEKDLPGTATDKRKAAKETREKALSPNEDGGQGRGWQSASVEKIASGAGRADNVINFLQLLKGRKQPLPIRSEVFQIKEQCTRGPREEQGRKDRFNSKTRQGGMRRSNDDSQPTSLKASERCSKAESPALLGWDHETSNRSQEQLDQIRVWEQSSDLVPKIPKTMLPKTSLGFLERSPEGGHVGEKRSIKAAVGVCRNRTQSAFRKNNM